MRRLLWLLVDYSVGALIRVLDALTIRIASRASDHMDWGPH